MRKGRVIESMRIFSCFALLIFMRPTLASAYSPLERGGEVTTELTLLSYDKREVPLKIYLPEREDTAPVVLLSHGLGGSREGCAYLAELWASRGFVVVAMQHVGSDDSVWKAERPALRRSKLKRAANGQTFQDRMRDVPATLDQLEKWQLESGHFLERRLDLEKVGMGGHSYGAKTVQALAGQVFGPLGNCYQDERIDAALALSPSPPRVGGAKECIRTDNAAGDVDDRQQRWQSSWKCIP